MEPIIEENLNRLCRVSNGDVAYFIAWINVIEQAANGALIPDIKALVELHTGKVVKLDSGEITFIDETHRDLALLNEYLKEDDVND